MAEAKEIPLDLSVDPNQLPREWGRHVPMYHYWAEQQADAQAAYDEAKSELDLVKAEMDLEVRNNKDDYGIDKINNDIVANTVLTQPEVQAAVKRVNESRHQLELAKAATGALDHRRKQLSMLVDMKIKAYMSDVYHNSVPDEAEEDVKKHTRRKAIERKKEEIDDDDDF